MRGSCSASLTTALPKTDGVARCARRRGRLRLLDAGDRVEGRRAVVLDRLVLGVLVALPLLGDGVHQDRSVDLLRFLERGEQRRDRVAVDRADIAEAELLEEGARSEDLADPLFESLRHLEHRVADARKAVQHRLDVVLELRVALPRHQRLEVLGQRADRRGDRHRVVVQDDDQPVADVAGLVHRLERHAGGHRAVADDGDDVVRLAAQVARDGEPERRRDRGRGVAGGEHVVLRLAAQAEAGEPAVLAQAHHPVAPAGEDLVRVGLVPDVPEQQVARGVEDVVERDRQLDRAEVRREVSARLRDDADDLLPQLLGERLELLAGEPAEVGRVRDTVENRHDQRVLSVRKATKEVNSLASVGRAPASSRASSASAAWRWRVPSTP